MGKTQKLTGQEATALTHVTATNESFSAPELVLVLRPGPKIQECLTMCKPHLWELKL